MRTTREGLVLACFVLIACGLALFMLHTIESSQRATAPCEGSVLCAPLRLAPNGGFR